MKVVIGGLISVGGWWLVVGFSLFFGRFFVFGDC